MSPGGGHKCCLADHVHTRSTYISSDNYTAYGNPRRLWTVPIEVKTSLLVDVVDRWAAPCIQYSNAAHCNVRKPVEAIVWLFRPKHRDTKVSAHGCLTLADKE